MTFRDHEIHSTDKAGDEVVPQERQNLRKHWKKRAFDITGDEIVEYAAYLCPIILSVKLRMLLY